MEATSATRLYLASGLHGIAVEFVLTHSWKVEKGEQTGPGCILQLLTILKSSVLLLAGFSAPTANGLPGARPPGPRGPAVGARPVGPPAMGAPPMSAPPGGFTQQNPQALGSGFAPPQQSIGRPGMAPPGTLVQHKALCKQT